MIYKEYMSKEKFEEYKKLEARKDKYSKDRICHLVLTGMFGIIAPTTLTTYAIVTCAALAGIGYNAINTYRAHKKVKKYENKISELEKKFQEEEEEE